MGNIAIAMLPAAVTSWPRHQDVSAAGNILVTASECYSG